MLVLRVLREAGVSFRQIEARTLREFENSIPAATVKTIIMDKEVIGPFGEWAAQRRVSEMFSRTWVPPH